MCGDDWAGGGMGVEGYIAEYRLPLYGQIAPVPKFTTSRDMARI